VRKIFIWLYCALQLLRKGAIKRTPKGCGRSSDMAGGAGHGRVFVSASSSSVRPSSSCGKARGSLYLLKDLKKIQTSLRADDIVWDS